MTQTLSQIPMSINFRYVAGLLAQSIGALEQGNLDQVYLSALNKSRSYIDTQVNMQVFPQHYRAFSNLIGQIHDEARAGSKKLLAGVAA